MNPLKIDEVSNVYRDVSRCSIMRHFVSHQGLEALSSTIGSVLRGLGDERNDDHWHSVLGPLRRASFAMCSTPLRFSEVASSTGVDLNALEVQTRRTKHLYPDHYDLVRKAMDQLIELLQEPGSPILSTLEEISKTHGVLSVVLRNPRMNEAVARQFAETPRLSSATVVSPHQLYGPCREGSLATVGPCQWFPEYVFTAPRFVSIHVVQCRWIRDDWRPEARFLNHVSSQGREAGGHRLGGLPRILTKPIEDGGEINTFDFADQMPSDPFIPSKMLIANESLGTDAGECVRARFCYLAGARAVFVLDDETAKPLVINPEEIDDGILTRVPTRDLEPGMYMLLRTSGGGDLVEPLADKILGRDARRRREQQMFWKSRVIRESKERFGCVGGRDLMNRIASTLRSEGFECVSAENVDYWLSSKSIHPKEREHFGALLRLSGIEDREEELWNAMEEIYAAHRKAGHFIRKMLLKVVKSTSLELLERDGEMVFELGEEGGGSLSAYRLTGFRDRDYQVPAREIGNVWDLERS